MSNLNTIRTDVVGSLLRPAAVIEERKRFDAGEIDAAALRAIEDDAVRAAVRLQEAIGLDVISDGEMRRMNVQDSFGESIEGYDAAPVKMHTYEQRVEGSSALRRWESMLAAVMHSDNDTYAMTLTVQSTDPGNPDYQRDAETILTGFQMFPPSDA